MAGTNPTQSSSTPTTTVEVRLDAEIEPEQPVAPQGLTVITQILQLIDEVDYNDKKGIATLVKTILKLRTEAKQWRDASEDVFWRGSEVSLRQYHSNKIHHLV